MALGAEFAHGARFQLGRDAPIIRASFDAAFTTTPTDARAPARRPAAPDTMPHSQIPDFTATELALVREAVAERFRKEVEIHPIEGEVRIDPSDRELTLCPGLYWKELGANFVIFKTGAGRFRCQFFYRVHQQFGTGRDEYDDLGDCVITLLQVQSDHDAKRNASA
jgi:hypothetical protein